MRSTMASRRGDRISLALILSYAFDWIIIIVEALIGLAFGNHTPNKRPFSLANPDISFPYKTKETISTSALVAIALIAPAVIIIFVVFIFVPGPTVPKSVPKGLIWKRKLWEWFAGWTGLALSCATAWILTNGMKNLFGHWRPDLLSRCQPDIANIANYAVGGYPATTQGSYLVAWEICQTTDQTTLDDGFRSFPSGHASFSAAGLIYLSLFLASKLAITIPFLAPRPFSSNQHAYFSAFPSRMSRNHAAGHGLNKTSKPYHESESIEKTATPRNSFLNTPAENAETSARNQSAAPPLYLLVTIAIPLLTSIYITSTRYSDFRHHGFDLLFGFFLGSLTAIWSFRLYHLPISQGAGWAWGPRSRDRAFWAGVGVGSYAGNKVVEEEEAAMMGGGSGDGMVMGGVDEAMNGDLEAGTAHGVGNGVVAGARPTAAIARTPVGRDIGAGAGAPVEHDQMRV